MDLQLSNEDISIVKSGETDDELALYDLLMDPDPSNSLIKRCVETPYNYAGRYLLEEEGLGTIDLEFGNPIYSRLSEPLTVSWISEANRDINQALTHVDRNTTVEDVALTISLPNKVNIDIQYTIDGTPSSVNLPIQL